MNEIYETEVLNIIRRHRGRQFDGNRETENYVTQR